MHKPTRLQAYSYGGVTDIETEWAVSGSFLNDFFVYACDQDKWSAVTLKAGMETKESQAQREQVCELSFLRCARLLSAGRARDMHLKSTHAYSARPKFWGTRAYCHTQTHPLTLELPLTMHMCTQMFDARCRWHSRATALHPRTHPHTPTCVYRSTGSASAPRSLRKRPRSKQ